MVLSARLGSRAGVAAALPPLASVLVLTQPLRLTWVQPPFDPTLFSSAPCSSRARTLPFGPDRRFSPLAGVMAMSKPSREVALVEAE